MTIIVALLLSLAPLLAFLPSIGSVDELVTRFGYFGLGVAFVAFVGHTLSLPAFNERKIGPTPFDSWGKTLRWNASFTAVLGLICTVFILPGVITET